MNPRCIDAVNAAAGRNLSASEILAIESRLTDTMRRLARSEKDWAGLSHDQRVTMAAERARQDLEAEASRKVTNAQLQILKTAAMESRIERLMKVGDTSKTVLGKGRPKTSRSQALADELNETRALIETEKVLAITHMVETISAAKSRDGASFGRKIAMFLWDADNPSMTKDLVREIFAKGEAGTGNLVAQEGAKAWLNVIELMRQRFNGAGGDVRKLEYGYLPQPHDPGRVRAAGPDAYASKVLGLLDRSQYLREDGSWMTDPEVSAVLREAWNTIQSEGMNKVAPGAHIGEGARANRGSDARVIHFKDGDAWLQYMAEFGKGNLYDAMIGHVGGISRSISLVERYGPNPNAQMRLQFDLASRADGELEKVGVGLGQMRVDARGMWSVLNGSASSAANETWAGVGQTVRNIETATKLGFTVLKSLPDVASYFVTTGYNRLPYWEAIANLKRVATDASARKFLAMHGLMAHSAIESLNRWSVENIRQSWSGQLANSTMRLSLAGAWDDWFSRAFGMTKMHALGNMAGTPWENLTQWDRALLERRGVTTEDWSVINQARVDDFNGMKFLTPDSIMNTGHERGHEIASKVLSIVRDEIQYAVIKPDLTTQAARTWNGTQAGTGLGEFARSTMLFKSFPFAMVTRHFRRLLDMPAVTDGSAPVMANRLVYSGALILAGTALGAIANQGVQVVLGKDPIDMFGPHAAKFWAQAFATGGGLGFYGDLLMRNSTEDRGAWDSVGKTLGGPVISDMADLYSLTKGNIDQYIAGKPSHAGAEMARYAQGHLPYVNLWYAKAAVDHAVMHSLQESLSPGYLERMRSRAEKDWGQGFWWQPGAMDPSRAPDLGVAFGQ